MKNKYIELNTESIEEYNDNCKDILSYYIVCKRKYLSNANYYNAKLNITNKNLNILLYEINEIINEIRELNEQISSLEKAKVSLAYSHNQLLGNKNKSNIDRINDSRYYYNEIREKLKKLISYRNKLIARLNECRKRKKKLLLEKKKYSSNFAKSSKSVNICNYNIDSCYKVLNKIDNIYFYKVDRTNKSFFIPKMKKLK